MTLRNLLTASLVAIACNWASAQCEPGIEARKAADPAAALVGQEMFFLIEVENLSQSCELHAIEVDDPLLPEVADYFLGFGWILPGETQEGVFEYRVHPEDPDPLVNTVYFLFVDEY